MREWRKLCKKIFVDMREEGKFSVSNFFPAILEVLL